MTYRPSRLALVASLVAAAATTAGCGAQSTGGAIDATPAALEQANGGLDTADEAPEFADANFALLAAPVETGSDALLDASGALPDDPAPAASRHVYRVLVLWGHLPRPRDGEAPRAPTPRPDRPTDWTGSIAVEGGVLSVRRTVNFEERTGDRVAPRSDRARVEFASRTQPFVDGLVLTVRTVGDAPATLRMDTAPFRGEFDLRRVGEEPEVRYAPEGSSDGVLLVAYEEGASCARGFVVGHWLRQQPGFGGFRGRVFTAEGAPAGAVRGLWGRRRDGAQVFFGKHIANDGAFNGLLAGRWGDGRAAGVWGTRDPGRHGVLGARYSDGAVAGDGHGLFVGRWREACE